ncbi:MAG TPA: alcohol dehydrogenase catalytic domain-containing protein [Armatimonadota bacterium]|nr:alcohol dehydrogenase catalytic domain-containing protein [Armatimonadota bacterium]
MTQLHRQYDADLASDVPAEGFLGWDAMTVDVPKDESAIVCMHFANFGLDERLPYGPETFSPSGTGCKNKYFRMAAMRAMRLTGIRRMEMMEVPTPRITADDQVLIKMAVVGVCGSDVHYYGQGRIGRQVVEYPFTVGHEGAGVVQEVGAAVTRVRPGDRVAIEPAMSCRGCDQCLAGRPHTCRNLRFLGCPGQAQGCLSEYLVMPETSCFPIAASLTLDEATLSEPLAIGVYAVKQAIPMRGAKIGILGAGPIGLSVLLCARGQGAAAIYVTDKLDERLAWATKMGADWVGNPDRRDVVAAVSEREPGGLSAVFECCGDQEALDQAVEMLTPGGKLMLIGIPATQERVSFDPDSLRHKEICIQNVRRQNHCVQLALDMLARKDCDGKVMITHRFRFERSNEALDLVAGYRDGVVKAMIDIE